MANTAENVTVATLAQWMGELADEQTNQQRKSQLVDIINLALENTCLDLHDVWIDEDYRIVGLLVKDDEDEGVEEQETGRVCR